METLPAPCLVAVNLRIAKAGSDVSAEQLAGIFNATDLVGSSIGGDDAEAWTDFRIAEFVHFTSPMTVAFR